MGRFDLRGQRSDLGAVRMSPNGYHYTRTEVGWELTHRLVAGEKLGRRLADNERVRFKDGNRSNRDPDNLEVYIAHEGSKLKKLARLKARRDELQAQIDDLEEEINGA
jgi:hypothetical protein